jgi:hypothetical protein
VNSAVRKWFQKQDTIFFNDGLKKNKQVLSTIVLMLDVITSFMKYRREKDWTK